VTHGTATPVPAAKNSNGATNPAYALRLCSVGARAHTQRNGTFPATGTTHPLAPPRPHTPHELATRFLLSKEKSLF
jgi:hypothetical protein